MHIKPVFLYQHELRQLLADESKNSQNCYTSAALEHVLDYIFIQYFSLSYRKRRESKNQVGTPLLEKVSAIGQTKRI